LNSPTRTIAIVGGGFSGTTVAANLLRLLSTEPTRIVLIERGRCIARGVAYADRDYKYLLNVPAGRMSANPREPLEFLTFARRRLPYATAEDFLPRALYGEYLESSLAHAELSAGPDVQLTRLRAEIVDVSRDAHSGSLHLHATDGRTIAADDVVLALGNPAPASPPALDGLLGSARYSEDPWTAPSSCRAGETILIVGTSLTMADVVSATSVNCNDNVTIHAISRHGLLPPSQTAFRHAPCEGDSGALLREASFSVRRLMRSVRRLAVATQRQGGDWREAVTFVRNIAPALWSRLPLREKRRFLRHVRAYWDVHRHRLPQETLAQIQQMRLRGNLRIHAGRLLSCERAGDKVKVSWRRRGAQQLSSLIVDRVINCMGPEYNPNRSRDPLMHSLVMQRLASADPLGLGLRAAENGALIDSRGDAVDNLFYVGPQLRADHWEATAAAELRMHAERLAVHLADASRVRSSQASGAPGTYAPPATGCALPGYGA
jgi:uncharacterized NAD(P)/FAD-binding protein YdhS